MNDEADQEHRRKAQETEVLLDAEGADHRQQQHELQDEKAESRQLAGAAVSFGRRPTRSLGLLGVRAHGNVVCG